MKPAQNMVALTSSTIVADKLELIKGENGDPASQEVVQQSGGAPMCKVVEGSARNVYRLLATMR